MGTALERARASPGGAGEPLDPVRFPRRYAGWPDRETAALLASTFAFGAVPQILRFLERLFGSLGPSPHGTLAGPGPLRPGRYASLSYRFISPSGVFRLLSCLRELLRAHGTLESLYRAGGSPGAADPREGLSRFFESFRQSWGPPLPREREFLFPDPRRGSACKRGHLFLRWVVRPDDGVDLGLWTVISPAKLLVPVDTHVARISRGLGLTRRKRADGRMAEEVTASLRAICPEDPVRYDFALARIGIEGRCTARRRGRCDACALAPGCLAGNAPPPEAPLARSDPRGGRGRTISGIAAVSGNGLQSTKPLPGDETGDPWARTSRNSERFSSPRAGSTRSSSGRRSNTRGSWGEPSGRT